MANLPEYSIRYRYTGQPNTGSQYRTVGSGSFSASGNTSIAIGMITRIEYVHSHSANKYSTWAVQGVLNVGGMRMYSDVDTREIRGNVRTFYNTFTGDMPTPAQWAEGWTISTEASRTAGSSSASLYWRADGDDPMDVIVYFYAARDMVDGASAPTNLRVSMADGAARNYSATYGSYVQDWSQPVITCACDLDPAYQYLQANHTLTLRTSDGTAIYSATQFENGVFQVGVIKHSGTISYRYAVTDTAGNTVERSGTFTVLPYTAPVLSNVRVERYSVGMTDQGETTYAADDAGELLRTSLTASTCAVADKNAWTLVCEAGIRGEAAQTIQIASGADGSTYTVASDTAVGRSVLPGAYSAANTYNLRFVLTDAFGASDAVEATISKSGAILSIEQYGVAVGMRSACTFNDKRFEVANTHTAHFYGGIYGVTNYSADEVATGGRWIDGKPIYRRVFNIKSDTGITSTVYTLGNIADIDCLISINGTWRLSYGDSFFPLAHYDSEHNTVSWPLVAGGAVTMNFKANYGAKEITAILEYTKTTDVVPVDNGHRGILGIGVLGLMILNDGGNG